MAGEVVHFGVPSCICLRMAFGITADMAARFFKAAALGRNVVTC